MTVPEVEDVVNQVVGEELPDEWADALAGITIHVAASRADVGVLRAAVAESGQKAVRIPRDFRGLFMGTPVDPAADLDDEETAGPVGVVVLNAAMLESPDDVQDTLIHEFGHALGLDEDEIAALGLE